MKTKSFNVGDQIVLQSGETCCIDRKVTTEKGITLYMVNAKVWRDALWLTEREVLLNVV